ncbi:putative cell division control protein 25 [Ilyonectria robusta]|uniref:putative cell division control protein 25 n=1 Tax=Ilyonectria robusta TaxID=1079257 RepID=UPI001E8DF2F5|nr:putative cell division control protein 25 [Ilyonectria robusta]KAH8665480.1 putative cell division control protein 25 [Ilyonectria robusta]
MVSFTNQLANLVVGTILDHQTARKRAAAIEHWISIAQESSNLRNYDGLTALLSGIGHSAIVRLRRTWSLVSPKRESTLRTLQMLINPSHNHKSLRTLLNTHDAPCLPFLGLYLTDLAFVDMASYPLMKKPLDLGSKAAPEHRFINFTKYSRTAKIVRQLQRFQMPCELTMYPRLQQWLALKISQLSKPIARAAEHNGIVAAHAQLSEHRDARLLSA